MSGYYRAPILTRLVGTLNSRWPNRDHKSDGWIADAAHYARGNSDHIPDWSSTPPGVVRAEDIDIDGIHVPTVLASLFLHPSTRYVIYQKKIWNISRAFKPAYYTGTPHTQHIHDSIRHGLESAGGGFDLITPPNWGAGVRSGNRGVIARQVQAYLLAYGASIVLDGQFGVATDKALRAFQSKHRLTVDGIAGPKTLAAMRTA